MTYDRGTWIITNFLQLDTQGFMWMYTANELLARLMFLLVNLQVIYFYLQNS